MGGAVSTGQDNDDLVDNLVGAEYIRTDIVARVFRAVDRAEYFLPESRNVAYKDLAWKCGNLHLSAPCIYSEVMEGLCLKPGLSFLNLGSGTGYLSTMAGLILGSRGLNHGIEIYEDVIKYANKKLDDFRKYSGALDEYDFCEPKFIQGNCLCLSSDVRQYDRVYCGAGCPQRHENYMRNLIKVGGILVMPVNDQLFQIKRVSETSWNVRSMLPVSFATLIAPPEGKVETVEMIKEEPQTLHAACRVVIRNILRKNIEIENPNLRVSRPLPKKVQKRKPIKRLAVPFLDSSDDSDDEEGHNPSYEEGRNRVNNALINLVFRKCTGQNERQDEETRSDNENDRRHDVTNDDVNRSNTEQDNEANQMKTDEGQSKNGEGSSTLHDEGTKKDEMEVEEEKNESKDVGGGETSGQSPKRKRSDDNNSRNPFEAQIEEEEEEQYNVITDIHNVLVGVLESMSRDRNSLNNMEESGEEDETENANVEEAGNSTRGSAPRKRGGAKREKFDSGLGDEIVDSRSANSSDLSDTEHAMESCSSGDDDDEDNGRPKKRTFPLAMVKSGGKWRRIDAVSSSEESSQEDKEREDEEDSNDQRFRQNEIRAVSSPYTPLMKSKIQSLPLPQILKNYLNFSREF